MFSVEEDTYLVTWEESTIKRSLGDETEYPLPARRGLSNGLS